jgi:UDP-GlcNAc3NAcA epimerase
MKVVTVVGARPQFIKAAPLSRALRTEDVDEVLVHTGQHYDNNMSAVFFSQLGLEQPRHQLGIGSAPHGAQTGRILEAVEHILLEEHPDLVLVYGDTNSTLAGALAAAKLQISLAHVEAGLRSNNRRMPEEVNRVLTDHAANVLFAPTVTAIENLRREGLFGSGVHLVGDVMFDACVQFREKANRESDVLSRLGLTPGDYALATFHRAENTDESVRLHGIVEVLRIVSNRLRVVAPLHPRTRAALRRGGLLETTAERLITIEAVSYLDMVMLESHASLILTDSGGVQKEAFFHRVPCITLRDETEWVELVTCGWNQLVSPTKPESTGAALDRALGPRPTATPEDLYGDGNAAGRIATILCSA